MTFVVALEATVDVAEVLDELDDEVVLLLTLLAAVTMADAKVVPLERPP